MRKNSKARSWTEKRIKLLKRQGESEREAVTQAIREARKHGLVRNPEEEEELRDSVSDAEEVARGFHGRENQETFEIVEKEVYRENLACLGEMVELEVLIEARANEGLIPVCFSRENTEDIVLLGCSSDRKQLYLTGDTSLPDDWLEEACPLNFEKDKVPVGFVYSISYFADKHHLTGPKQQKQGTEYIHCFGEQTFKQKGVRGMEQKIQGGALPILIYNRLSGGMELVGGIYQVRDEGIYD
jgi:hypothetical protein